MVAIKPGDSAVVIGYHADEFTHTMSVECFIAQSHVYHGFIGKVSTMTHLSLQPGCED